MKTNDSFEIEAKKLKYLYENVSSAIISSLIIAILMYIALEGRINQSTLDIWITLTALITTIRLVSVFYYKKATIVEHNMSKYYRFFLFTMLISAILWSVVPFFLFPHEIEYQVLILLMLAGISTGAALSLATKYNYFVIFLLLILVPSIFIFFIQGKDATTFSAIAGVIYTLFLLVVAKKISLKINENISLSFSNENLINILKNKADEANSANEAKSKFLSVMSHEIRTPLNAIIGFVKILKDTETNSIKKKYLSTIDSSSYLLMSILNDILDISKIESGSFSIETISYEPYTELYQLYDLYEKTANNNGITMINSISMDMPIYLKGDILRLKQIISNLLSNAIKFTSEGKTIELIVNYEVDKSILYVEVRDEGIGIKKANIDKITQEFTQADDSTARKYGGSGLGLSIVKRLLSLQNSKLEIESKYGYGSSFYFHLPVKLDTKRKEELEEDITFDFSNNKVLVAEDNKTNQLLITIILENMNIEVVMANDGQEAEDMMKEDKFDLILMDINMPNKNGSEAMLEIKKFNEDIVIVALTANAVSGDKEKYINEGFDDYLAKPIDNNELALVLSKYLPLSPT